MKIVTWNVNGIRACINKGLFNFMKKENADIYCFQEVRSDIYPIVPGYEIFGANAEKKGYSGVLIYTKKKPLSAIKGVGDKRFDREGRSIAIEFNNFYLVNAYFPHSNRGLKRLDYKLKFNAEFEKFCKKLSKKKSVIIASDLNVAHKEIDLKNPKQNVENAGFTPEERSWFDLFLKQGYVDAFREFVKEGEHYSWWPYRNNCRKRNIGWRIDSFLVENKLKSRLMDCKILKDVAGSDHCPVRLELK